MAARGPTARLRAVIPPGWRTMASPALEYAASPLGSRRQVHRFVIVCGPRSGSELLRELLDSLVDVRCEGEVLRTAKRWPVTFLAGRAALGAHGHRAWGCKIIDAHLYDVQADSRPPGGGVLAELAADGWTILHLRRQDLLAQALSVLHALRDQWHFWGPSPKFEPFEADPAAVITMLYVLDRNARWLDGLVAQVPHATITYEDDLRAPARIEATLTRIADLLGVPGTGATSELRAVAPARPEDRITNLTEVTRAIEQTRFGPLVRKEGDGMTP